MTRQNKDPYAKRDSLKTILLVIIPVLAAGSGLFWVYGRTGLQWTRYLGHVILISGIIWMFCRSYVQFLWRKFPWDTHPFIHVVLEVLGIGLFPFFYGLGLYRLELKLGILEPVPQDELFLQVMVTLLITYLITGIHEMVYFYNQWIMNFSKSIRLERDNIQAKYEMLKAQVNPHFLFNSLNSLSVMVDGNTKAENHILNLSEFLRYLLSSRDRDLVCLEEELGILNHYLELQKARFTKNLKIVLEINSELTNYVVPPLSIQMLVENCIKHNVISEDQPLEITIRASDSSVSVVNNLQRKSGNGSTGQGLKNLIERYSYFTNREVMIRETESEFSVKLPLLRPD